MTGLQRINVDGYGKCIFSYNLIPFYNPHKNILRKPLYDVKSKATISYTNITFLYCRSSTICTYGRTKMAVILIALFSLVYNIPRFFEVTWDTPTPIMVKKEIYYCHIQHLYDSSTHQIGH